MDELIRREQERRVVGEQLALARARYEKLQERTTARSRRTNEAEAFRTKLERLNEERLEIEARIERQTRLLEGARARAAAARAEAETAHRGLRRAWRSKEATAARLEVVKLEQLTEEMRYRETRIERLRHERALNPLTEDALRELRRRVDARDKAREASAVSATRLDLRPETGRKARLDGLDCTADEPLYLVDTTEITLEGWGRVRVTPGGTDVADRRKTLEEAEHALADMLERNGTTDLDAAETRAAERREVDGGEVPYSGRHPLRYAQGLPPLKRGRKKSTQRPTS